MAGRGSCSWYEFAMEIFRQAEVVTRVMASTSDMMERPAKRPANSVLASGRSTPITLPEWQRGLADYLARRDQPEEEEPRRRSSASRRQPVLDHWERPDAEEPGGASASPTSASQPDSAEGEARSDGRDDGEAEDVPDDEDVPE